MITPPKFPVEIGREDPIPKPLPAGWTPNNDTFDLRYTGTHPYLTPRLVAAHIKDKSVRYEVVRAKTFAEAISATGEDPAAMELRCRESLRRQMMHKYSQLDTAAAHHWSGLARDVGMRDPWALAHLYLTWAGPVLKPASSRIIREFWQSLREFSQARTYTEVFLYTLEAVAKHPFPIAIDHGGHVTPIVSIFRIMSGQVLMRGGDPPLSQHVNDQTKRLLSWVLRRYQEEGHLDIRKRAFSMFEELPA